MAYRGDDSGDALEAPTADGILKATLGPNRLDMVLGTRTLHIADGVATLVEQKKQKLDRRASHKIVGPIAIVRGWPRESFGIWIELVEQTPKGKKKRDEPAPMQRIFGVEPPSLWEFAGLVALGRLDTLAQRVRAHVEGFAEVRRGVEIGSGHPLDKVLVADDGERYVVYSRKLFRDRARFTMSIATDGKIVVPEKKGTKTVEVTSKFGVTVRGDYVRFADRHGTDLARVSVPWVGPEERDELARRIGQLVDRS
ncbi:MAG TPA: hypothetical protein VL326_38550 [Kofleriaceae bacterium]|jgi:hypothetical protein|nr:hypothetical protein [Kofleriaceae bacterium]